MRIWLVYNMQFLKFHCSFKTTFEAKGFLFYPFKLITTCRWQNIFLYWFSFLHRSWTPDHCISICKEQKILAFAILLCFYWLLGLLKCWVWAPSILVTMASTLGDLKDNELSMQTADWTFLTCTSSWEHYRRGRRDHTIIKPFNMTVDRHRNIRLVIRLQLIWNNAIRRCRAHWLSVVLVDHKRPLSRQTPA